MASPAFAHVYALEYLAEMDVRFARIVAIGWPLLRGNLLECFQVFQKTVRILVALIHIEVDTCSRG